MHTYSVLCLFIMFYIYIQRINKLKTEYVLFSFTKQHTDYWFTNVLIHYLIYTFLNAKECEYRIFNLRKNAKFQMLKDFRTKVKAVQNF